MTIDTLWYTRCPVVTAFGIAVRLGLLEQEFRGDGIQVQSLRQSLDKKTRNSHFEHTQPDSFRHGGNIPALFVRSRGADVRLLGVTWANEVQQVLTLPSSGIRTVRDLKGRRLALPRRLNDAIDFWRAALLHGYASALSTEGLSLDDVELVDIPIERSFVDDAAAAPSADGSLWNAAYMRGHAREEIFALVRGQADALFAHGSVAVDTRTALGARVVVDIGSHPDRSLRINNLTPLTLTVSGGLLAQAPEVIARWLARIIEAAEWAKAHPADATRLIAAEVGVPEEFVELAFGDAVAADLTPNFRPENLAALDEQKRFLRSHGFLSGDVDLDAWIAREPLEEAQRIARDRARGRTVVGMSSTAATLGGA